MLTGQGSGLVCDLFNICLHTIIRIANTNSGVAVDLYIKTGDLRSLHSTVDALDALVCTQLLMLYAIGEMGSKLTQNSCSKIKIKKQRFTPYH